MTSPLRVFISHSAKERRTREFLAALAKAIRGAGHQIMLDRDGLEQGVDWRATLNMWMDGCDAAIILLSTEALCSRYVMYETSVLTFRKELYGAFGLLPVVLPPVTYEQIEASPVGITMVQRWQSPIDGSGEDAIESVLEALARLRPETTPLDKPARQIAHILRHEQIAPDLMIDHFERLGVPVPPWLPHDDLPLRLASAMLARGLEASKRFLRAIRSDLQPRQLGDLIDLIASAWVDYHSVRQIPSAATNERVIASNATRPKTARMYVIRAAIEGHDLAPHDTWPVAGVDGITAPPDEAPPVGSTGSLHVLAELSRQVRTVLAARLDTDPETLDDDLRVMREEGEPVFVALPAQTVTADVVNGLRRAFDGVAFFLLVGDSSPSPALKDMAVVLEPELEPRAEDRFIAEYEAKMRWLMQTPH